MAFPTVPTAGAGRVLTATQADTTAVRTFPSLTGLTKNAGDRLIAICAVYQSSAAASAVFGTWGGGFTEIADRGGTTSNMSIGVAEKVSTGSETGTFTVTQAATVTGHAMMILLSIPGAHASTASEVSPIVHGTGSVADPASFNPAGWDVEDTLWISVGASGETSLTGSYTGMGLAAGPPTNYGNAVSTGESGDAIGAGALAVAFRQNATAAEDVGAWSAVDTSNARNSALVIAVRPAPSTPHTHNQPDTASVTDSVDPQLTPGAATATATAEVSLALGGTPTSRTLHTINVRARVTTGSGTIRAQLYEGASPVGAELETGALTGSLADYEMALPDADAEDITNYGNLSIRFRGYSAAGDAAVFEVAELSLETPESSGTPHSHSVNDTASVSDGGAAKTVNLTVPDTATVADTNSKAATVNRADTGTLSDDVTAGGTTSHTHTVNDTAALADAASKTVAITAADTLAAADARAATAAVALADTGALSDTADPQVTTGTSTTSTARISLEAGDTPDTRTSHTITVRARVTNGAHTGTIRARLYEGATPITAELETGSLTAALADYTLTVPDADAEDIGSYADLEIAFRGYSSTGDAATFEIAELALETPAGSGTPHTHTVDDTVSVTDNAVTDTGGGTDHTHTVDDTATLTDSGFRVEGAYPLDDTATVTDSVTTQWDATLTIADGVQAADNVSTGGESAHTLEVNDTVAGTDALAKAVDQVFADAFAGSDALQREWDAARTVADTGLLADSTSTSTQEATNWTHTVTDTATASDTVGKAPAKTQAEAFAAADLIAKAITAARSDGLTAGDDLARAWVAARAVADDAALTDLLTVTSAYYGRADGGATLSALDDGGGTITALDEGGAVLAGRID